MNISTARLAELLLPGAMVGVVAAVAVGGLALYGGLDAGYAAVSALGIGLPLAAFGAGYSYLLATARIRIGGIAPAAVYWLVGYTISRTIYEVVINLHLGQPHLLSQDPLPFFGYQVLISTGFAVGFMWLHENLAPLWWVRIRHRNPIAAAYVGAYMQDAVFAEQKKAASAAQRGK